MSANWIAAAAAALALSACGQGDPAALAQAAWQKCDPGSSGVFAPVEERIAACTLVTRFAGAEPARRSVAYYNRGVLRADAQDNARAVADFGRALRLDPSYASAYLRRGMIHHDRSAFDAAIADYDHALALDPGLTLAAQRRDMALTGRVADFQTMLARASAAIEAAPRDAGLLNGRCWLRAVEGVELDLALIDCNESLRRRPREANTLDSRGLVYLKLGEYELAFADYGAALALDPDNAHYLYGRGLAQVGAGRRGAGAVDLSRAIEIEGAIGDEYASYGLADLLARAAPSPETEMSPPPKKP